MGRRRILGKIKGRVCYFRIYRRRVVRLFIGVFRFEDIDY